MIDTYRRLLKAWLRDKDTLEKHRLELRQKELEAVWWKLSSAERETMSKEIKQLERQHVREVVNVGDSAVEVYRRRKVS